MCHSFANFIVTWLRIFSIAPVTFAFLVFVVGCAEVPVSPLAKPQGIGTNLDTARNDANVFFFEDFEDRNYADHFSHSSHPGNRQLVGGDLAFNGEKSLRIAVNRKSHYGVSMNYRFTNVGMDEPTELYARYYLRFDESWKNIKGGGKLPGPAGRYGKAGWGGRQSDGSNGWSARMRFGRSWLGAEHIDIGYYTYHADMSKKYGKVMPWHKDDRGTLQKNRWYCIETHIKLNTPGKHDGILRGWIDGYLAMEKENIRFRTTDKLKIEEFWVNVYYGGGWRSPDDMYLYIDNLALSTRRIGTAAGLTEHD